MINHVNRRSLRASEAGKRNALIALTNKAWSREDLMNEVQLSRATVMNFFSGRPIDYRNFVNICQALELDWQEIARGEEEAQNNSANCDDIEAVVQQVRRSHQAQIQYQCGTLRMLDVSRAIALTDIFTEVNVLEQITSQQWRDIEELIKGFNPQLNNFDRLGLGKIRQARVSGLDAVSRYRKLMVLGKPGSGKTTFLQHIAIKCNQGEFEQQRVPIFIKLKEFAEDARDRGELNLLNYIIEEFNTCRIATEITNRLLAEGKALILLDGLDEVAEEDSDRVVREIRRLSQNHHQNYFVITCRIAAFHHQFQGFTDVEVADFNSEQVESFAQKWFVAVAGNKQSEGETLAYQFIDKLLRPENQAIRELAVTPILLNLTCLVFQAKADFPSNRSRLYEQGLDILLRRWDKARGICRDEVYHSLTLARKKQLLSQLAAITFEQGDYFFEQSKIQQLIADYLQTLSDAKTDPDEILLDSEAVLKSIEAQHGLLVERAKGIYSFSHLTFQEYFTAKHIVNSSESQALEKLVSYIGEKRWWEVFSLVAETIQNATYLLQVMKQQIDALLADDEKLQQFLMWVNQKSISVNVSYKPVALRAFYFALDSALYRLLYRTLDPVLDPSLYRAFELALNSTPAPISDPALNPALDYSLIRVLDPILIQASKSSLITGRCVNLNRSLDRSLNLSFDPELRQSLQQLKDQLLDPEIKDEEFYRWWKSNGLTWTEQLKSVMIKHRNIGHDWQFSYQQKELLRQYYDTNNLLVDCLNRANNVTPTVREEIEDTLLLPIAEIEQRASYQSILTTGYKK
jgi:predicted NACHT family NTPase